MGASAAELLLPGGKNVVRGGRREIDSTGDGASEAGRGGVADGDGIEDRIGEGPRPGRDGKNEIAVDEGVGGADGPRHAVLRRDSHALELSLVKGGVGGDDGDGGVGEFAERVLHGAHGLSERNRRRVDAKATKFAADLPGGGPEVW